MRRKIVQQEDEREIEKEALTGGLLACVFLAIILLAQTAVDRALRK